jgi:hypothetical protein
MAGRKTRPEGGNRSLIILRMLVTSRYTFAKPLHPASVDLRPVLLLNRNPNSLLLLVLERVNSVRPSDSESAF